MVKALVSGNTGTSVTLNLHSPLKKESALLAVIFEPVLPAQITTPKTIFWVKRQQKSFGKLFGPSDERVEKIFRPTFWVKRRQKSFGQLFGSSANKNLSAIFLGQAAKKSFGQPGGQL
jgi:hypothetical protein